MEDNEMNDKARKLWVKIMAIVLAALMAVGTIYSVIALLLA